MSNHKLEIEWLHDEYECDYDEAEEIGRQVTLQNVTIKYIHGNHLVCC